MKVVIHPYRNGRVERNSDWIDNKERVLFVKIITNPATYLSPNLVRIYPPKLNKELLNWIV